MNREAPNWEEFEEFYNKYPHGNPKDAYNSVVWSIENRTLPNGNPVTWKLIKAKWREYFSANKHSGNKLQYVKKMDKFINDQDYLSKFEAPDSYILKLKEIYKIE